jgi:hypothetical protein
MARRFLASGVLRVVTVAGLLAAIGPRPVAAQITTLQEAPTVIETDEPLPTLMYGLTALGSFSTYDMLKVNEALAIVNEEITQPGVSFSNFERGATFGGGIRVMYKEKLIAQIDFERLLANQKIGGITAESEIRLPADAIMFTLAYDMMKARRAGFGVAAGIGRYEAKGEQIITETDIEDEQTVLGTIELGGTGIGFHGGAFFEAALAGHIWFNFFAGYRGAHVDELEITGLEDLQEPAQDQTRSIAAPLAEVQSDGTVTLRSNGRSLDWSGFMGRAGLTWYFNAPD